MRPARLATAAALLLATALPATAAEAIAARPAFGKRVPDTVLAGHRGGNDTRSDVGLQGAVIGNQAINVTTGGNSIGGGAFGGATGIPVVVQNTGNNVLVQSSVIVNVQLK